MQKFRLSIPALHDTIAELELTIGQVTNLKNQLMAEYISLTSESWSGEASVQFAFAVSSIPA